MTATRNTIDSNDRAAGLTVRQFRLRADVCIQRLSERTELGAQGPVLRPTRILRDLCVKPLLADYVVSNEFGDHCAFKTTMTPPKLTIDYSLYLVTGRELLPPGKVSVSTLIALNISVVAILLSCMYKDYFESLEEVYLYTFAPVIALRL